MGDGDPSLHSSTFGVFIVFSFRNLSYGIIKLYFQSSFSASFCSHLPITYFQTILHVKLHSRFGPKLIPNYHQLTKSLQSSFDVISDQTNKVEYRLQARRLGLWKIWGWWVESLWRLVSAESKQASSFSDAHHIYSIKSEWAKNSFFRVTTRERRVFGVTTKRKSLSIFFSR